MNNNLQEWLHHPVTKVLLKVLEDDCNASLDTALNFPDGVHNDLRIKKLERIKVLKEIINLEQLLLGELEEIDR